jgi:pyruvate dehydrogenase E2 component (dihydrolipoyllysine-residue acetyltransferase)
MASPVIMPKQGQSVESCILTAWNKKKGDPVKKGDILFSYETDKASFEAESETEGILLETFFSDGDEIPVLTNVAVIGQPGESAEPYRPGKSNILSGTDDARHPAEKAGSQPKEKEGIPCLNPAHENRPFRISPRARVLAECEGVPVKKIKGSGPEGRIIERDIRQYLQQHRSMILPPGAVIPQEEALAESESSGINRAAMTDDPNKQSGMVPENYTDQPITHVRRIIAKAMLASLQHSAQLTHHMGADVSRLLVLRKKIKALQEKGYPYNITLNDMVCYAVIRALNKHPAVNAHFLEENIRYFSDVHLGFAVDTDRGLMVPALHNASELTLPVLSQELRKMADQCRNGNINPDLLAPASASFTVSNLGNYGVEFFTPVINLPQVAILGVNSIVYRLRLMKEVAFEFAPYIGLSLTYDHRALDGGPASQFLAEIRNEIEGFEWTFEG